MLLFQFFVLAGNRFWFYILLMYLEYHNCGVVLVFLVLAGNSFLVLRTYLVYNMVVRLCHFFCCGGKVDFVQIQTPLRE